MYSTNQFFTPTSNVIPMLDKPVVRHKPVRAVRPAAYRVTASNAPGSDSSKSDHPAAGHIGVLGSTLGDFALLGSLYFPGRLTCDGGSEWHSPAVRDIRDYRSGTIQRPLATWEPEDFESDFDRSCESSVAVSAMAHADSRRFPMRDFV